VSQLNNRKAIVCFDGLNADQFDLLKEDMPLLSSLLKSGGIAELDAAPFSDVQPIWAEILTGEPWYRNGCIGYARPLRSLNHLQVFTERDLTVPIRLFNDSDDGMSNVLINAPIVQPRDNHRIWLSDGGSPAMQTVSPLSLSKKPPFQNYNPRPLVSMGEAMADCSKALTLFVNAELNRLQCAATLALETNWKFFLYRASIFDQLSHLLGHKFLQQKGLAFSPHFKKFLTELDSVLASICEQADERVVFSSFSHVHCKGMFSINDLLENARFLSRSYDTSSGNQLRLAALAAARAENDPGTPINLTKTKQFLPRRTLCASPVRGTLYINSADRFDDGGAIDDAGIAKEEIRIAEFLKTETNRLGQSVSIHKNPELKSGGPNFIFQIREVELVESLETISRSYDLPLSTHCSTGFIWSPKLNRSDHFRSVDLPDVMR
jgi:predicted AlkP superfamily phosphohydrolase/phosphomutase